MSYNNMWHCTECSSEFSSADGSECPQCGSPFVLNEFDPDELDEYNTDEDTFLSDLDDVDYGEDEDDGTEYLDKEFAEDFEDIDDAY